MVSLTLPCPHHRLGAPLGQVQAPLHLSSPVLHGTHLRCSMSVYRTDGWRLMGDCSFHKLWERWFAGDLAPCTLQDNNACVSGFLWWQLLQLPILTERRLLEAQMHVGQESCCQDPKQTVWSECVLPSDSGKYHWYSPGNLWNLLFIKVSPSVILSLLLLLVTRMFAFHRDSCH